MIIFLDFDGVITHSSCSLKRYESPIEILSDGTTRKGSWYDLDPKCVKLLNKLISLTNSKVVISSTWRQMFSYKNLETHLKNFGFIGEVIGSTPWKMSCYWRDQEIQWWMEENNYTGDYLILDDEQEHLENAPEDNFVYIYQGWTKGGLTSARAKLELTRVLRKRGIVWEHSF